MSHNQKRKGAAAQKGSDLHEPLISKDESAASHQAD
jgi:hypothetical protein